MSSSSLLESESDDDEESSESEEEEDAEESSESEAAGEAEDEEEEDGSEKIKSSASALAFLASFAAELLELSALLSSSSCTSELPLTFSDLCCFAALTVALLASASSAWHPSSGTSSFLGQAVSLSAVIVHVRAV